MGDYRTTTGEAPPESRRARRTRFRRTIIVIMTSLLLVIVVGFVVRVNQYVAASGYVTTELYAEVRPTVVGRVAHIACFTGDTVAAGDLLLQLDESERRAALEESVSRSRKAEAELEQRRTELEEHKRQREKNLHIANLRLENAIAKFGLTRELHEKGLASGRTMEDARLNMEVTKAEMEALSGLDASIDEKTLDVLRQELEVYRDSVAKARAQLDALQVRAPIAGRVLRYEFVPGELVRPDTVLFEIFGGERQVLKLRVPERHAAHVQTGQAYLARLLPYEGLRRFRRIWFHGNVETIRNVIQSEGQATYRVVTCGFDPRAYNVPPGTTAEVKILIRAAPVWSKIFRLYPSGP